MVNTVALEFAEKTDTGLVRSQNEDAIALSPEYGFAILADGMGGYSAGEVASSIAVNVFKQSLEASLTPRQDANQEPRNFSSKDLQQFMVAAIRRANMAIIDAVRVEPRYRGMGTTLVAALFQSNKVTIAHVGDSRAYRLRQGVLTQITRDHSLVQQQIDAGKITLEMARLSPERNLVTRAVGIDPSLDVEVHDHLIQQDDIYLLCSDGLSDMVADEDIADAVNSVGSSLKTICSALVKMANQNGGRDNTSVVLIKVGASSHGEAVGLKGKLLKWFS